MTSASFFNFFFFGIHKSQTRENNLSETLLNYFHFKNQSRFVLLFCMTTVLVANAWILLPFLLVIEVVILWTNVTVSFYWELENVSEVEYQITLGILLRWCFMVLVLPSCPWDCVIEGMLPLHWVKLGRSTGQDSPSPQIHDKLYLLRYFLVLYKVVRKMWFW